jgi:hypothetical protein
MVAMPAVMLSLYLGYTTLWYQFSDKAAGARADHPCVEAYATATAISLLIAVGCFIVAAIAQRIFRPKET